MCEMDQGEPVLVPQWYKSANGSTTNHTRLNYDTTSSGHSDDNGGLISRTANGSERKSSSLRRSFSSNGSASGKSQAYSSFRSSNSSSSRKINHEKDGLLHDRENRTVLVDNGFHGSWDIYGGIRRQNDILRRSHSMVTERKTDIGPKKLGTAASNGGFPGSSTTSGALGKTTFEKDFPSLGAERKAGLVDLGDSSLPGLKTAAQSIHVSAPVIIGTSALAEVPGKIGANGHGPLSALQSTPFNHTSVSSTTVVGLNMAETLAQAPSQNRNAPQVSIDTQKIEELNLRKCKQLIPVTPPMPKAFISNMVEKIKSKGSKGGESIVPIKGAQQSTTQFLNYTIGSSAKSDVAKPSQAGNLQVLNREKNAVSPTAKEATNVDKVVNPFVLASSAASHPLKNPTDQKVPSTQSSFWERKPLTQAQNRNDFFNLLRKKSSASSNAIPEAGSCLDESNMQILHSTSVVHENDNISALAFTTENGNHVNGRVNTNEGLSDIGESNFDAVDDPEEETFLESLGWDKSVKEEALTKEEIDEFLRKYEKQRPLKLPLQPLHCPSDGNGSTPDMKREPWSA